MQSRKLLSGKNYMCGLFISSPIILMWILCWFLYLNLMVYNGWVDNFFFENCVSIMHLLCYIEIKCVNGFMMFNLHANRLFNITCPFILTLFYSNYIIFKSIIKNFWNLTSWDYFLGQRHTIVWTYFTLFLISAWKEW